jgi:penicillin amidase
MYRVTLLLSALIPIACSQPLIETVPQVDVVESTRLSGTVDVVRDQYGVPHIYGGSFDDVAYAQGYMMASDRLVQLDLARRSPSGTLAEIAGSLSAGLIDTDIRMRVHHMRKTSEDAFAELQMRAASDPDAKLLVAALGKFAAGVNDYVDGLKSQRYYLPVELSFTFDYNTWQPWTEVDSLVIGRLVTFDLSYDADSDIARTALDATGAARFDQSGDPARSIRKGIARDLQLLAPMDPTYTLPGDFSTLQPITASAAPLSSPLSTSSSALALLLADRPTVMNTGNDRWLHPDKGSNNWVIGPSLSASGHTLVANDPHLSLQNPSTFYLVHLNVGGSSPLNVTGAQFPGAPGVILGMNQHVAWGATTSNLDVTDVYQETIVPCDDGTNPCVMWKGQKVALVPRTEKIGVGRFGTLERTIEVTLWDVPHHGPILPRITADHGVEPLGSTELSVRWTGHEVTQELLTVLGLDRAKSVKEAETAIEQHFKVGGENWVLGDDQGHFGWTQASRVPRRPAGTVPWKVLPGDGSAEWGADLDLRYVPHAFDPAEGFLATANADPIGVTDDGEPFASEPVVDGAPLYIGAGFDSGTRVGRITKRLKELSSQKKLTLEDLQAIQADDVSEWDAALAPTFLDAAQALAEEIATPGAHPELTTLVAAASPPSKAAVPTAIDLISKWTFDTPTDSRAATLFNVWVTRFALDVFEDEFDILGFQPGSEAQLKLLVRMCTAPQTLSTIFSSAGDNILFDDLNSVDVVESKRYVAARALFDAVDYLVPQLGPDLSTWTWGRLHTLTLQGLLPIDALQLPPKNDPNFPNGFPRHGDNGTVDVGEHGLDVADYSYAHGPVIRAVYELDPKGPRAKNALPGGEILDAHSPHFKDLMELWRVNQTFDVPFADVDVVASAKAETALHNLGGRIRFRPK